MVWHYIAKEHRSITSLRKVIFHLVYMIKIILWGLFLEYPLSQRLTYFFLQLQRTLNVSSPKQDSVHTSFWQDSQCEPKCGKRDKRTLFESRLWGRDSGCFAPQACESQHVVRLPQQGSRCCSCVHINEISIVFQQCVPMTHGTVTTMHWDKLLILNEQKLHST